MGKIFLSWYLLAFLGILRGGTFIFLAQKDRIMSQVFFFLFPMPSYFKFTYYSNMVVIVFFVLLNLKVLMYSYLTSI